MNVVVFCRVAAQMIRQPVCRVSHPAAPVITTEGLYVIVANATRSGTTTDAVATTFITAT